MNFSPLDHGSLGGNLPAILGGKLETAVDYTTISEDALREELEAMRSALQAFQTSDSEARLRLKIEAAERELDKRNAKKS